MGSEMCIRDRKETDPKKHWIEFGPLIIFFVVYMWLRRTSDDPNSAIYPAAAILAILSIAAVAFTWLKDRTVPGVLVFSAVLVCFFAGIAYLFQDPRLFYIKPTIINSIFGAAVIGGVIVKKNVLKILLMDAFELPDKAWNALAIRYGIFFFACAGLNAVSYTHLTLPTICSV